MRTISNLEEATINLRNELILQSDLSSERVLNIPKIVVNKSNPIIEIIVSLLSFVSFNLCILFIKKIRKCLFVTIKKFNNINIKQNKKLKFKG